MTTVSRNESRRYAIRISEDTDSDSEIENIAIELLDAPPSPDPTPSQALAESPACVIKRWGSYKKLDEPAPTADVEGFFIDSSAMAMIDSDDDIEIQTEPVGPAPGQPVADEKYFVVPTVDMYKNASEYRRGWYVVVRGQYIGVFPTLRKAQKACLQLPNNKYVKKKDYSAAVDYFNMCQNSQNFDRLEVLPAAPPDSSEDED